MPEASPVSPSPMSKPQAKPNEPQTRRRAMLGLAEHVWDAGRARWILRPRLARIFSALGILLASLYLAAAWVKYAENKWIRDCERTSYPEICLFIFPDKIPFTKVVWVPDFVHNICERARDSHREKLSDVLLAKAKTDLKDKQWGKFFQGVFGATKLNPQNKEARMLASQALFALRRDDDAMEALEEALPELLSNREFIREYIVTSFQKERYARLLGVAKYHLANATTPPEAREAFLLAAAHCHFERGEFEDCARVIAEPGIARTRDAFMLKIKILRELGKNAEALAMLGAAAAQNPSNADLAFSLIGLRKECGDTDGAREAASLFLLRASDSYQARIRMLDTLDPEKDRARIDDMIAAYRRDFARNPASALALCEYAANNGKSELCEQLRHEADAAQSPDAPRMRLLFIESHLAQKRYLETVRLVDELFLENPEWLNQSRLQFDSLRMVAHFALDREDTGEIGFKRVDESQENLNPRFMEIVAHRLIEAGRNMEAIRVIELSMERNRDSVSALAALISIHLQAGGTPTTPARLAQYLKYRRPSRSILVQARQVLGGDAYIFDDQRTALIADIETLMEGRPVVKPATPIAPQKAIKD